MPTYHCTFTYTELGRRKLKNLSPEGRRLSVQNSVENIGGELVELYWDANLTGGFAIVRGDNLTMIDMTALSIQVGAVGYVRPSVQEVFDTAAFTQAMNRAGEITYQADPLAG
jgi:uncharacterized protein with GYD domain